MAEGGQPEHAVAAMRQRNAQFPVERLCQYFTAWAADPDTTPAAVAQHSGALEKIADLATAAGLPEQAVLIGRAASPKLARSLNLEAWGRLLGRGQVAARGVKDRSAEAYFTHEQGIRSLVTGRRVAAAALLAEAVVLWKVLGAHHGATVAQGAQQYLPSASGPPMAPGPTGHASYLRDLPGGGDTFHTVADQPMGSHYGPTGHGGTAPTANVPVDGAGPTYSGPDPVTHGMTTGPGPGPGSTPCPGDGGASATGWAPIGPASVPGAATVPTVMSAPSILAAALTKLLIVAAILGAVAAGIAVVVTVGQDDEATGIVGTWEDEQGNRIAIVELEPGEYSAPTGCGLADTTLSGDDTQASGQAPLIDISAGTCGPVVGTVEVTITVASDGNTAQLVRTLPSGQTGPDGEDLRCDTCGTFTLTRVG